MVLQRFLRRENVQVHQTLGQDRPEAKVVRFEHLTIDPAP
jgi:hypothetical protein